MSQPQVIITELDGALGILPPSAGNLFACIGPADAGPIDSPAAFAKVPQLKSTFQGGPVLEAACHYVEKYGRPVVVCRTGNSVDGSYPDDDAVTFVGTGTSVITVDNVGTTPNDDYQPYWEAVTGGNVGTAGITFRWSLDGGRTKSPVTALDTANSFVFPGSGGVQIDFAAGTIVAGDVATFATRAPNWNAAELGTALDAMSSTVQPWELGQIVGPIDAAAHDLIETKIAGMFTKGKYVAWLGNTRMPDPGETEAAYLAALSLSLGAKATKFGALCAGACKMPSSVSGRNYRRPIVHAYAALEGSVAEHINTAEINVGSLAVSIRDVNGNPDEHDESINPGLDDARFTVLRTHEGEQGVYVNRPRLYSAAGSDFQLLPHRRVMNLAHRTLRAYFIRRLSKPVLVDKKTGFILEGEALEIEKGALKAMRSTIMATPKASEVQFALSRTDNLLSTKTMTGQARVIPLAYPEFINLDVGFLNPALQVLAVAA